MQEFPVKMYRVIGVARRFSHFADPDIHFACLSVRRSDNTDVTFTPNCWRTMSESFWNSHVFNHYPVTPQSPTFHVLTPPACQAMVATWPRSLHCGIDLYRATQSAHSKVRGQVSHSSSALSSRRLVLSLIVSPFDLHLGDNGFESWGAPRPGLENLFDGACPNCI
jgi:hypothetical protein